MEKDLEKLSASERVAVEIRMKELEALKTAKASEERKREIIVSCVPYIPWCVAAVLTLGIAIIFYGVTSLIN